MGGTRSDFKIFRDLGRTSGTWVPRGENTLSLEILDEVSFISGKGGRDILWDIAMAYRLETHAPGCHGVSGRDWRGVGSDVISTVINKSLHHGRISPSMGPRGGINLLDMVRLGAASTFGPDVYFTVSAVSDVFKSTPVSDERVVSFRIRGVEALFIGGLDSVFKLHQDHVVVFDIDLRG